MTESPLTAWDVSRALAAATRRHPGFDWATSPTPLPNGRFETAVEPFPGLWIDPRLPGDATFDAVIDGIADLDARLRYADVVPIRPGMAAYRSGQTG